jgi:TetR/AcrR family transcriptional repressor of nem operon
MRVSKEQAAQNHRKIVTAASRLFRERGISATGVDAITEDAGLTHGAVYSQFGSKEVIAAEAMREALAGSRRLWRRLLEEALDFIAGLMPRTSRSRSYEDAIAAFAFMAGALILARAVSDDRLSNRILDTTAKRVIHLARSEGRSALPRRRSTGGRTSLLGK